MNYYITRWLKSNPSYTPEVESPFFLAVKKETKKALPQMLKGWILMHYGSNFKFV